jgi:hypothetical protein
MTAADNEEEQRWAKFSSARRRSGPALGRRLEVPQSLKVASRGLEAREAALPAPPVPPLDESVFPGSALIHLRDPFRVVVWPCHGPRAAGGRVVGETLHVAAQRPRKTA